jgi:hypothetical protein
MNRQFSGIFQANVQRCMLFDPMPIRYSFSMSGTRIALYAPNDNPDGASSLEISLDLQPSINISRSPTDNCDDKYFQSSLLSDANHTLIATSINDLDPLHFFRAEIEDPEGVAGAR